MQIANLKVQNKNIFFVDKDGNPLSASNTYVKIVKRIVSIFEDLSLYFLHAVSMHIPSHTLRHLVFRLYGVGIGKRSTVHMGCRVFSPMGIKIGEDTKIGDGAFLDGRGGIKIGDHVDFASQVMIYTSEHDLSSIDFGAINEGVVVGDYVFVGPRTIILPGVKIGMGAVVAAGAVVTKNVNDFEIVGGVPATVIGVRKNKSPKYTLGRARLFQ